MKTTTAWNCGNFTLTHGADVSDDIVPALVEVGLLHLMQRNAGIDKALGIVKMVSGKPVRSKTKRVDVPFSDDIAQALADVLQSFTVKIGEIESKVAVATGVSRYDRDAASVYKFSEERKIASAIESETDADALPKLTRIWAAVGKPADSPTHGEDGEFSPEYLAAIRARRAQVGV